MTRNGWLVVSLAGLLGLSLLTALPLAGRPAPAIILDGLRDAEYVALAEDPAGDLGIPGSPDTAWTDLTTLYVAADETNLYIYVDLPDYAQDDSSGEIGLALETTGDLPNSGGAGDPWGNAITYAYTSIYHNIGRPPVSTTHTLLPDAVIRGNIPGITGHPFDQNNGWTELRLWDGSGWSGAGENWGGIPAGGQIGSHIAYANHNGVELAIPFADLGGSPGSTIHLEFYTTQKSTAKGVYDTLPSDNQSQGWDDPTVQRHLATYEGVLLTPTPTATPSPGPSPTPTASPTAGPTPTPPSPGPCSGAAPGDGDILTDQVYHNSRQRAYRDPFGPIPQDGYALLRLRVCANDVEQVEAWVWETGDPLPSPSHIYTATVVGYDPAGPYDIWEVQVPAPDILIDQWYQFRVVDGARSGYYHVLPDSGNGGPGAWSDSLLDLSWRLGTYLAGFETPAWVQDAVIYQIFPDRFRNGNPANDPAEGSTLYGPETCSGSPCVVELHDNWLDPPNQPPFGVDFSGGDLEGVLEKLPYLADLGINTIYFNPIFEASSNHGYDTNDYYAVREILGGDAAFDQLVAAAQGYGIRIVLDGVFNHAGSDSRYMDGYAYQYGWNKWPDVGACESASSPYRGMFVSGGTPIDCDGGWHWNGWWGFETIPEWAENDETKEFFFRGGSPHSPGGVAVAAYWVDRGAAGWRFDVAQDISHAWWKEMRPFVKGHLSSTLMLGEVTAGCMDWSDYLRGDELDAVMNYCFRDWAIGLGNGNPPSQFDAAFTAFREQYPKPAVYAMMNLLDSHDTARALNMLGEDKRRLKLVVLLQMTLPGAPSVYYGDEVGLSGSGDPDCRRPYPWADQGGNPDLDLLAHYRTVIGIRRQHSALRGGAMETLLVDTHLYAYIRYDEQEYVVVVLNNGSTDSTARVPVGAYLEEGTVLTDTLNGGTHTVEGGDLYLSVPAHWGAILVATPPLPQPDLSTSDKAAPPVAAAGQAITYTLTLRNTGTASATVALTDTPPLSVTVLTDSLPGDVAWDGVHLRWSGVVPAGAEVARSFAVRIEAVVPPGTVLTNTLEIDDGAGGQLTRYASTRVQAGGWQVYLPLVARGGGW